MPSALILLCAASVAAAAPAQSLDAREADRRLESAEAALKTHRTAAASAALDRALELSLDAERLRTAARLYEDARDLCGSARAAERLCAADPRRASSWIQFADAAAYCGRREDALKALDAAASLVQGHDDLDQAAYLALYLDDYERSLRASDLYVQRFSDDLWHWFQRAAAEAGADRRTDFDATLARAAKLIDEPAGDSRFSELAGQAGYQRARWILTWTPRTPFAPGSRSAEMMKERRALGLKALAAAEKAGPGVAPRLAMIYRALGETAAARRLAGAGPPADGGDFDYWYELAVESRLAGSPGKAADAARRAAGLAGDDSSLLRRAAALEDELGDCGAGALYDAVLKAFPDDSEALVARAAAAARCGDREKALSSVRAALASPSMTLAAKAAAARVLLAIGGESALPVLEDLARASTGDAALAMDLADARSRFGTEAGALEAAARARALAGADEKVTRRVAALYARLGDCEAVSVFEGLVAREPKDLSLLLDHAAAAQRCGAPAAARASVDAALALAGGERESTRRAARILTGLGDARAVRLLEDLLRENPGDPDLTLDLAEARAAAGGLKAAVESGEKARALSPGSLETARRLASLYANAAACPKPDCPGRADALAALAPSALSADPLLLRLTARAFSRLGEPGRAAEAHARLAALAPRDAAARADLGVALFLVGKKEEATRALVEATALEPGRVETALSLASVYAEAGRKDDAANALETAARAADPAGRARLEKARRELNVPTTTPRRTSP